MAPAHILDYFLAKRKTRFFPYFIGVCELFTTTLLILLATATWPFVLGLLGVSREHLAR